MALYAVKEDDEVKGRTVPVYEGDKDKEHKIDPGRVYDDQDKIDRQVLRQAPDCFVLAARGPERGPDPLAVKPEERPNPLATTGVDDDDLNKANAKAVKAGEKDKDIKSDDDE